MSDNFHFAPAVRKNRKIIAGFAGPSGSGKTWSALELATGLAEYEGGSIALIDTEGNRALDYADVTWGDVPKELRLAGHPLTELVFQFDYLEFEPPYTPMRCGAVLKAAAQDHAVVIFDSMSDEHEGDGGGLDMKDRGDKFGAKYKAQHKENIVRWLRRGCPSHVILCFRAQEKVKVREMMDPETGRIKTEVIPIPGTAGFTAIAEKNFLFEMTCSIMMVPDSKGFPIPIKIEAQHQKLFPPDRPVTRAAGAALARWAAGEPQEERKGPGPEHVLIAETMARKGSAAFRAWWKTLPKITRDGLRDSLLGLQGIADTADRKLAPMIGDVNITDKTIHYEPVSSAANPPTASEGVERSDGLRSGAAEDDHTPGNQADPRTDPANPHWIGEDDPRLPPRLAEIDTQLREMAEGGPKGFNKMWQELPDETKATLRSRRPEYEAIATAAIGGMGE